MRVMEACMDLGVTWLHRVDVGPEVPWMWDDLHDIFLRYDSELGYRSCDWVFGWRSVQVFLPWQADLPCLYFTLSAWEIDTLESGNKGNERYF